MVLQCETLHDLTVIVRRVPECDDADFHLCMILPIRYRSDRKTLSTREGRMASSVRSIRSRDIACRACLFPEQRPLFRPPGRCADRRIAGDRLRTGAEMQIEGCRFDERSGAGSVDHQQRDALVVRDFRARNPRCPRNRRASDRCRCGPLSPGRRGRWAGGIGRPESAHIDVSGGGFAQSHSARSRRCGRISVSTWATSFLAACSRILRSFLRRRAPLPGTFCGRLKQIQHSRARTRPLLKKVP